MHEKQESMNAVLPFALPWEKTQLQAIAGGNNSKGGLPLFGIQCAVKDE